MPLDGLDAAGLTKKMEQAVSVGEQLPRSPGQSLTEGRELPLVVD